jgi:RsiW-degrading membrane proteinase PrsW (M82 family)
LLALACAASAVTWAALAAWRAHEAPVRLAARALLGGAAAFGLGVAAYDVAEIAGLEVSWARIVAGDLDALGLALLVGFTEEGAKLAGILLVVERRSRAGAVVASAIGVAAAFAALEALLVLRGAGPSPVALARAAFGPVSHATLSIPLVFAVAMTRSRPRPWMLILLPALAAAAALHAGADLSLALPGGRVVHAAVLLGPALWVFARARRPAPVGSGTSARG